MFTLSPTILLISPKEQFLCWSVMTRRVSDENKMYGVTVFFPGVFTFLVMGVLARALSGADPTDGGGPSMESSLSTFMASMTGSGMEDVMDAGSAVAGMAAAWGEGSCNMKNMVGVLNE